MPRTRTSLKAARLLAAAALCATAAGAAATPALAFNPQPDPPGRAIQTQSIAHAALNPQPLPPIVDLPSRPGRI